MSSWTECAARLPKEGRRVVVYKKWGEVFCAQLAAEVDEDGYHHYWAIADCGGDSELEYGDQWSYLPLSSEEITIDRAKQTAERYGDMLKEIAGVDIFRVSRERVVAWCRYMAMWQMQKDGFTTIAIGEAFGRYHQQAIVAKSAIDAMCLAPSQYPELIPIFKEFRKRVTDDGQRDKKEDKERD